MSKRIGVGIVLALLVAGVTLVGVAPLASAWKCVDPQEYVAACLVDVDCEDGSLVDCRVWVGNDWE